MNFGELNSFLAPTGLIIAGIVLKLSGRKEQDSFFKKHWYLFIILGVVLLVYRVFKYFI